jgi:hypothetical protein
MHTVTNKRQSVDLKTAQGQPTIIAKALNNSLTLEFDLTYSATVYLDPKQLKKKL